MLKETLKEMVRRAAQSTLEYVIILTAIIAVVIAFAFGALRSNVKESLTHVGNQMEGEAKKIDFNITPGGATGGATAGAATGAW